MTMKPQHLPVLDKGFVTLIDRMGDDRAICEAARVSYKSEAKTAEDDRKLVRYLWDNKHTTPFEHVVFKFHVKAPIFVARQWFRHRMASYNETSFRYREAPPEFYVPKRWRAQDTKNKQGSKTTEDIGHAVASDALLRSSEQSMLTYEWMLHEGIAKEMARMVLPTNLYTEFYWTVNLHSLMHFTRLRSEKHAQWEIKQFSNTLWSIWAPIVPWTAEAFFASLPASGYSGDEGLPGPNLAFLATAAR